MGGRHRSRLVIGSRGSTAVEVIMHFHRIKKRGGKSQIRKFSSLEEEMNRGLQLNLEALQGCLHQRQRSFLWAAQWADGQPKPEAACFDLFSQVLCGNQTTPPDPDAEF